MLGMFEAKADGVKGRVFCRMVKGREMAAQPGWVLEAIIRFWLLSEVIGNHWRTLSKGSA